MNNWFYRMRKMLFRTAVVLLVIFGSLLVFSPNFLEQELAIVFKREIRLPDRTKQPVDPAVVKDFAMDRENGLGLYFPNTVCKFQGTEKVPATHRCVLKARFITAARINELTQAYPNLLDDFRTGLLPHPIERAFGSGAEGVKNLKVRLGLDLQGGMRAVFRADFKTYLRKLTEKYDLRKIQLAKEKSAPKTTQARKVEIDSELRDIERILSLEKPERLRLLSEARKVIVKRLDKLNLSEPEVRVQNESYSIGVDMPGVTNSSSVLQDIKKTETVEYRIVADAPTREVNNKFFTQLRKITEMYRRNKRVPEDDVQDIMREVTKAANLKSGQTLFLLWRRGAAKTSALLPREFRVLGPVVLDGDDMTNATTSVNPNSGYYDINFELGGPGTNKFCTITRQNVNKALAILWGDRVVSDPNIRTPICGGRGVINGSFTKDEAEEVSGVIREGALPLPLEILSVSFIGPSLGKESIVAGVISIILGFILVIVFMVGYYKLAGLVANFALFLNLLITAAILSLLEFTLTLPGFAGVILTVGMAVDANVIIFEKIKEDIRAGKTAAVAVESGFASSFWTILDANVTTLIAAVILWKVGDNFGDSAIKGFSITLFFGLVSSMFTALFVSRLLFDWAIYLFDIRKLSIAWGKEQEVT